MGLPSPHDIYGILKYEDITYNLANRVFDKSLEKKLKEYVEKENISYFPIYPHIPKNPFTTYEIINNKLYITGISYNDKPYNIKEIFGKEMVECDFDITGYFTTFFHPFHKKPSTFLTLKQACKIVA